MKPLTMLVVMLAASASVAVSSASGRTKPTLMVGHSRYGQVLFGGNGRALYAFTRDHRGGPSRCYGDCARAWPVYYASGTPKAGKGVKQALIGTVRRKDGRLQVTYHGRPLYYYVHDVGPGRISCQNVAEFGGTWLVVRPSGRLVR